MTAAHLTSIRTDIDALDQRISSLVEARAELVRQAATIKKPYGLPPRDAAREAAIIAGYVRRRIGMSEDRAARFAHAVLEATRCSE